MSKIFDFIIIGGGSAGSVLANRLSKNPSNRVLVIEAGRPDYKWDFRLHMPAALTYPLTSKTYNWWYESDPEPYMNNRRIYHPRGKVLGGSSSINGMIWIRGNPLDYQKWAQNDGLENWDYAHCLPYFKRLQNELNIPVFYVTHSLNEVLQLVDTMILMEKGTVRNIGPVEEMFSNLDLKNRIGLSLVGGILDAKVISQDEKYQLSWIK